MRLRAGNILVPVLVAAIIGASLGIVPALISAELPDTVVLVKQSIVGVGTVQRMRRPPGSFIGTGFVVGDGNYALTNAHTVERDLDTEHREFLSVLTDQGARGMRRAQLIEIDEAHDVALLRFEGPPLPALRLGDSSKVREGELYAFTGFPIGMALGFRPVTHRAIVSAITPIAMPQLSAHQIDIKMLKRLRDPYDVFQLDGTAYLGNSGSPLYNVESGTVVGVINSVFIKESKENVLSEPSGIT